MTDDIQKITGQCKNIIITQNCKKLKVTGQSNKVKIKSEIKELFVSGMDNHINGEEQNCLIHTVFLNGMDNFVKLNSRSANAKVEINGMDNKVKIGDRIIRQSSSNNNNSSYKKAHPITKMCAEDLTDLVIKKSKGRKDLIEDEFTKSLSFISGIDESLL